MRSPTDLSVASCVAPPDRRRRRYVLTEKGRSDLRGHFGEGALRRGRRRYSTCLSGTARRRQALRIEAVDELADAFENETRHLFGGLTKAELTQLGSNDLLQFRVHRRRRPGFDAFLRAELLGERSPAPGDEPGLCHPREELLAEPSLEIRDSLTFDARLRAELLVEGSAVKDDG
jgi:hypothetical protein